jgi:hypothetical protein
MASRLQSDTLQGASLQVASLQGTVEQFFGRPLQA